MFNPDYQCDSMWEVNGINALTEETPESSLPLHTAVHEPGSGLFLDTTSADALSLDFPASRKYQKVL